MASRKKYIGGIILSLLILAGGVLFLSNRNKEKNIATNLSSQEQNNSPEIPNENPVVQPARDVSGSDFSAPLSDPKDRVTKKPFGIFITQKNSPVSPERFSGFHTGTDFEVFPEEIGKDVSVAAICEGRIVLKKKASGYGGVLVESCLFDNQPITVVYGHLNLASISKKVGDQLQKGEFLGFLGKDKSVETDGERKHLHLGIHKGEGVNILGYVQNKKELDNWVDACTVVCK